MPVQTVKTSSKKKTQVREKEHSKSKLSVIIPEREDGIVEKGTERYLRRRKRRTHREGKGKKKNSSAKQNCDRGNGTLDTKERR